MKTACIYHSIDLDGWMSAAIVKHWFIENNRPNNYIIDGKETARGGNPYNPNSLDFIGYNYGQSIPDLSKYDKVIMCDISFPKEIMVKLKNKHQSIFNPGFIYIDHHISAMKDLGIDNENAFAPKYDGIQNTNFAACELTWKYFFPNEDMPEIVRLLGLYDSFRHKNTDEETKVLEFQYGARQCISNYEEAYCYLNQTLTIPDIRDRQNIVKKIHNQGKTIYQYLCTEAKQTYKNGFEINFENKDIDFSSNTNKHIYPKYKFICINKERFNPINFGIDYHKDGYDGAACFYLNKDKKWSFSLYNDNGLVDCSQIAKQYGGGGHKGAAGMIVDLEAFKSIVQL